MNEWSVWWQNEYDAKSNYDEFHFYVGDKKRAESCPLLNLTNEQELMLFLYNLFFPSLSLSLSHTHTHTYTHYLPFSLSIPLFKYSLLNQEENVPDSRVANMEATLCHFKTNRQYSKTVVLNLMQLYQRFGLRYNTVLAA